MWTKRNPTELCCWGSSAVSVACNCYVTGPTGPPSTVSMTFTASTISTQVTTTITSQTSTSTSYLVYSTSTTSASPRAGAFILAGQYNNFEQPTQYFQRIDTPNTVSNFEDGYRFCSSTCGDTAGCTQIFFGGYSSGGYRCLLGTSGANAWTSSQIVPGNFGAPQVNYWYNFV